MNNVKIGGMCCVLVVVAGCATNGSTDPREDSLPRSLECTLTRNCENFNINLERDLEAERIEARRNQRELDAENEKLVSNQANIDKLQQSLKDLDSSIAQLRRQAENQTNQAKDKRDEIELLKRQLKELQEQARTVESDVLKEDISIDQATARKAQLTARRDELESFLQTVLTTQL